MNLNAFTSHQSKPYAKPFFKIEGAEIAKKKTLVQYSPNHLNIFKFQVQCCRYDNLHRYQIWHTIFLFGR